MNGNAFDRSSQVEAQDRRPALDGTVESRLASALTRGQKRLVGISDFRKLSGGASQEIWAFTTIEETPRRLIMRRALYGKEIPKETAVGLTNEAHLQIAAAKAGVPVAKVVQILESADELGPGFIMEQVDGETIPRRIIREDRFATARSRLPQQCGEALALIHGIKRLEEAQLKTSDARGELEQYRRNYKKQGHPHPVFDLAFCWLEDHMPPVGPDLALVHGDFRIGNLMVDETGLRAVLDWEISHLGDPMEDLGYMCVPSWRFGNLDLAVGGFGTREALFKAYEEAGGHVDPDRVRFWEILGTLKWGVICATMAITFSSGIDPSVERGTIGRRSSEAELDLLHLISGKE
jgi:aminoglycoside phosphotransferase (APT) family kinase protein